MRLINSTPAEIYDLIATHNRPMIAALRMCIADLERLAPDDPEVAVSLRCANKAIALELGFQAGAPTE